MEVLAINEVAQSSNQNGSVQSGELVEEEMSASKAVFQHFYPQLVDILPMDDTTFLSKLFSANLLPGNVKDQMQSMSTQADKATHLLDHVIQPSVKTSVGGSFDDLIKVMEDSEYVSVKDLAGLIRCRLRKRAESGVHSIATKRAAVNLIPMDEIRRFQARYLRYLTTDWPHYYVRLALVKEEKVTRADKKFNEITKQTLQGEVDKILKKKEPLGELKDIFHYQNKPCPRLILIMGGPGVGKTTLANEICVKWAKDGFLAEDFDIVVLIPLRSVQQRSFEEIVMEHIGKGTYELVKKSAGSRCLMIFEGWDEMAAERRDSDIFLVRVVKDCTLLEEATIMITSRPHACETLDAGRRIEVIGFGKEEIHEFVKKSFPNDANCVEFSQQLKEYPHLESLSYVPMNLAMIIDVFKCSENMLPSTTTQLYQLFIVMTLKRQVRKEYEGKQVCSTVAVANTTEEKLCRMLAGIPQNTVDTLLLLCKLAYHGFFKYSGGEENKVNGPKIIFTVEDLKQCGIESTAEWDGHGLLKATHTYQLPIDTITYNFSHLTIQEFLCAVYISTLSQVEQQHLLHQYFSAHPNVFIFVSGLTGLVSNEMFQFMLSKISGLPGLDDSTALKCLYESQQSDPSQLLEPLYLYLNSVSLYECLCVSFVLSYYPVSELCISWGYIGGKEAEFLSKHFPNNSNTGHERQLEVLLLRGNELTSDGLVHIMNIVRTSSASLTELDISYNPIGDDGISLLSSKLQYNNILQKLSVECCNVTTKGAIAISEVLEMCSLQYLNISWNYVGDGGIIAIAGALGNSQISELNVKKCDITLTGATALAVGLQDSDSVRKINLCCNFITEEGACLILQSAVNNGVCEEISIFYDDDDDDDKDYVDGEYYEDYLSNNDEVMELRMILEQRKRQELQEDNSESEEYNISDDDLVREENTSEHSSEDDDQLVTQEVTAGQIVQVNSEPSRLAVEESYSEDDHQSQNTTYRYFCAHHSV